MAVNILERKHNVTRASTGVAGRVESQDDVTGGSPVMCPVSMATITDNLTILAVADLEVSLDFYVRRMGFQESLRTGGWSFLQRGSLKLRIGHCPGIVPMSACQDHSLIVQAVVDDADALHEEFRSQGVDVSEPEDKPWGQREFGVLTPDGHRFLFAQALRAASGDDF